MPALVGQVVMTLRDATGAIVIQYTASWVDGTGEMRDAVVPTSTGNRTGALVVDNLTGLAKRVVVRDAAGAEIRSVTVPANGAARTAAQLASAGIDNIADLNGLTFDLT